MPEHPQHPLFPEQFTSRGPVYDITGRPAPDTEIAYQRRVDDLLRTEQALLLLRAQQAAAQLPPQQPVTGQVIHPAAAYPAAPPPAAAVEPVPAKAKAFAVVSLATGGTVALGGIGLRAAQPALAEAASLISGLGALVVAVLLGYLLRSARPGRDGARGGTEVHVHKGARVKVRNLHIR